MSSRLPLNLKDLLRQRRVEGDRIEYKSGWSPDPTIRTLCAFANDFENLGGGYIIIGQGGTVGFVGQARGIPYDRSELAMAYALAAQTLGMRFVYLEAGSGAKAPVPLAMIELVKSQLSVPLIVGGGIRDGAAAEAAVKAGADIIVTGNMVEETDRVREMINNMVAHIESAKVKP